MKEDHDGKLIFENKYVVCDISKYLKKYYGIEYEEDSCAFCVFKEFGCLREFVYNIYGISCKENGYVKYIFKKVKSQIELTKDNIKIGDEVFEYLVDDSAKPIKLKVKYIFNNLLQLNYQFVGKDEDGIDRLCYFNDYFKYK